MDLQLDKAHEPAEVQREVQQVWDDENLFHAEPSDPGEPFSIVIPPPNVTAALHLGHALNNTVQDVLVRQARMMGKNAVWIPGTDHAGIATQSVVEKRVLAEEGRRRTEFSREEFVDKIQKWKDEYERVILGQLKAMGCSCDWNRIAFTMDEQRATAVREAFFRLFKDGLIYRGKRLVNWDPVTQTALADDEVENEEVDGHFYYLKYPVCDANGDAVDGLRTEGDKSTDANIGFDGHFVTVATTRPETMLGDTAVAVNPSDPRAAVLRGLFVKLPIVGRIIPIIEDDYVVKPVSFGGDPADIKAQMATGFLKVTPAHDPNDWDIGQRHKLPVINIMAADASISLGHGWSSVETDQHNNASLKPFLSLSREEARKSIIESFKSANLLQDQKPYRHSVGHSYRSHAAIEPYLSDQWYVAVQKPIPWMPDAGVVEGTSVPMNSLAGLALTALETPKSRDFEVSETARPAETPLLPEGRGSSELRFVPDRYAKTFHDWNAALRDWCISRQLWWGHRIPVWSRGADHRLEPAEGYTQDPDVLDTWFSSALWPMSTLGWPSRSAVDDPQSALNTWNPTSVLCTAREIITLWVSRMVMFNRYLLSHPDEKRKADADGPVPFRDVFIHAMIQDGEGRKMSKSLGNGVDPLDIISSHGADAMRFTLASMTTHTQDVRLPVEKDPVSGRNTSPKFDLGRNFCNKLWNAARFVLSQVTPADPAEAPSSTTTRTTTSPDNFSIADRWILARFNQTLVEVDSSLKDYRFDQYAHACYDFFWRDYCDWYIEAAKPQLKDPAAAASTRLVLAAVLDGVLRLLHPLMPFVTERLWWSLNEALPTREMAGWITSGTDARASQAPDANADENDEIDAERAALRLARAAWPEPLPPDELSLDVFAQLQLVVTAVRTARNDYKVEPKRLLRIAIVCDEATSAQVRQMQPTIESMASCDVFRVGQSVDSTADETRVTAGTCEIYIEGLVDKAAEEIRTQKRLAELQKKIATLTGRLNNKGYTDKAPPQLVTQTQKELADAQSELSQLRPL